MSTSSIDPALAFIDANIWLYAFSTSQDSLKSQRLYYMGTDERIHHAQHVWRADQHSS
jgi:predicted nucleic acid-binding protein